jgi:nitrate reductase molybdenum cofactor assembly chaperone
MKAIHEILADIVEYPTSDSPLSLAERDVLLHCESQLFVNDVIRFIHDSEALSLCERQELYARTFDLNPACALEIGYHLFGENYKRGVFLANLRQTEEPFAVGQANQLPDYLPVLLRLLVKLDEQELRASLIAECLLPALEKMLKAFGESENPYRYLLKAICTLLESEVTASPAQRGRAQLPVISSSYVESFAERV